MSLITLIYVFPSLACRARTLGGLVFRGVLLFTELRGCESAPVLALRRDQMPGQGEKPQVSCEGADWSGHFRARKMIHPEGLDVISQRVSSRKRRSHP